MDYSALQWLLPTPRNVTGELETKLDSIHPKPFFAGLRPGAMRKWREEVSTGTAVLAGIVQASSAMYDPAQSSTGAGVFTWTRDPRFAQDAAWIADLAARLQSLRGQPSADPALSRLGALLNDEQSSFFEVLPPSITGGVEAHWAVGVLSDWDLPDGAIPPSRVVPAFLLSNGTLKFIPASLYGREKKR